MKKITRVRATSVGKVMGMIYGFLGLIAGGVATIFAIVGNSVSNTEGGFGGIFLGVGAIIVLPIAYGLVGYIFGILSGWIYNLAAKWVGGLEIEVLDEAN
jgi:hypothetical protein